MKLTKKTKIITAASLSVIMVAIIVTVILTGGTPSKVAENDDKKTSSDVVVNIPSGSPAEVESSTATENGKDNLVVDVGGNPTGTNGNSSNSAKPAEKSVTNTTPSQPNNGGGINIGGGSPQMPPYDCGTAGHKCPNEGVHRAIAQMETDGCSFCGSHNCPSFYAINKYGVYGLDVTQCPKYDKTKDPLYYCQVCHKQVGNGYNGTCIEFINDTICPDCGVLVKGRTCHSH